MSSSIRPGFAHDVEAYHKYRQEAPAIVTEIADRLLGQTQIQTVVDLGCGTGLSTGVWIGRARSIIGIEPNSEMREIALRGQGSSDVQIREGSGEETGLEDESVDVVACGQSLHWMTPEKAHPEIVRILKPGGILLAYGYDLPPTMPIEVELAYQNVARSAQRLIRERELLPGFRLWPYREQLPVIEEAGWYRYVKEAFFHQEEDGTADSFLGLVRTFGGISRALSNGISEEDIGIPDLEETARDVLGTTSWKFIFHYKMLICVK